MEKKRKLYSKKRNIIFLLKVCLGKVKVVNRFYYLKIRSNKKYKM